MSTILSKIGGLLALLKVLSFVLKEYHRVAFEKEHLESLNMKNFSIQNQESFTKEKAFSYKEIFNFKNLRALLKEVSHYEAPRDHRDDFES